MNATIVKEATDILKRLSPENQAYFMTLVRVAEAAEKVRDPLLKNTSANRPAPTANHDGKRDSSLITPYNKSSIH